MNKIKQILSNFDSFFLYRNIMESSVVVDFKYYIIPLISLCTAMLSIELFVSMSYILFMSSGIIQEDITTETIIIAILSFPSAIVFGRFFFRYLPLQHKINSNYSSGIIRIVIAFVIVLFVMKAGIFDHINRKYTLINIGVFLLFQIFVIKKWFALKQEIYPSKYVLFLRRFTGIADISLFYTILKATPKNIPIILLTDPDNRTETWDPFLIGFAGLKFLNPIKSIPIYIESDSYKWKEKVHNLVENSVLIIFDLTNNSASMDIEKDIVSKYNAQDKSIFLIPVGTEKYNKLNVNTNRIFQYSTGYFNSFIRLLLGTFILFLTILVVPAYFGFNWSNNEELLFYLIIGLANIFFWKKNISSLSSIQLTKLIKSCFSGNHKLSKKNHSPFERINISFKQLSIQYQIDRIKRSLLYLIIVAFFYDNQSALPDFIFVKENLIVPLNIYFSILLLIGVFNIVKLNFSKKYKVIDNYISEYLNNYQDFKDREISDLTKIRVDSLKHRYIDKFSFPHTVLILSLIVYLCISTALLVEIQEPLPFVMFLSPILVVYLGIVPLVNYIESWIIFYKFKKFKISKEEFFYLIQYTSSSSTDKIFFEKVYPLIMHKYILSFEEVKNNQNKTSLFYKFINYSYKKTNFSLMKIYSNESLFNGIYNIRRQFNILKSIFLVFLLPLDFLLLYLDMADSFLGNFTIFLFFVFAIYLFYVVLKKLILQKKISISIDDFKNYKSLIEMIDDEKLFFKSDCEKAKKLVYESFLYLR
ncbi:MAG: hypothetical protein U9N59_16780 [Campylobacterota bacterium]|nr:hypothetical protein [Campylobacterota bacterium]